MNDMSILKFVGSTPRNLQEMFDYMTDEDKTNETCLFGIGVNPANAVYEMQLVQRLNGRYNLIHEYKQIIFSFDDSLNSDVDLIKEVCQRIGEILIVDNRQVFGAIHGLGTNRIHCHYMINYVGIDGQLFKQIYSVHHYKKLVNDILLDYGLTPINYFESVPWKIII